MCRLPSHKKTPGCALSVSAAHAVAQFTLLHDHTWMTGNCHNYCQLATHHHPQLGWQDAQLHTTPIFIHYTLRLQPRARCQRSSDTICLFNCPFTCFNCIVTEMATVTVVIILYCTICDVCKAENLNFRIHVYINIRTRDI